MDANAQEIGGYPLPDRPAGAPDINGKPPPEHLLGKHGPWKRLHEAGLDLVLQYTGEGAAVIDGGDRKGADYAGQALIKADADLGKIAELSGASAHIAIVNRHGRNVSADYLKDTIFQAQEIYGGGGGAAAHLVYAYGELALAKGTIDIEGGRLPVAQDFASSPFYCDDLSTVACGSPHVLPGDPAFTIFPNSTWGGRLRIKPLDEIAFQAGAYQVRPRFGGDTGFNFGASGQTGTYVPVEIDFLPTLGSAKLPGHYKAGFTYDSSGYADLLDDSSGVPFAISGQPARSHHGRNSWYFLADQMIARSGPGSTDGVSLLGGYVHFDGDTAPIEHLAFAGVHAKGLIRSRKADAINLLFGYAQVSGALAEAERLTTGEGLAPANGAPGVQSHETVFEANYNIHIVQGLHLAPDIQRIVRPGAAAANRSATVLALKFDMIL